MLLVIMPTVNASNMPKKYTFEFPWVEIEKYRQEFGYDIYICVWVPHRKFWVRTLVKKDNFMVVYIFCKRIFIQAENYTLMK